MTHQSDIVARLRAVPAIAFEHAGQLGIEDPSLAHEAAALIETQAATIEALRAELAGRDAAVIRFIKGRDYLSAAKHIRGDTALMQLATAIASGAYRETGNE